MKNLLFTLLLLIAFGGVLNAQSVCEIQPLPASGTGGVHDNDVAVDAKITNLTDNTIHMKWERQVISLTPGCETAVCDPNICWFQTVSTKNFDMDPHEVGDMLVHFYNHDAPCSGIIHIKVSNLDNPADTTIAIYYFNASTGTQDLPAANVRLYPNPVSEYFSLDHAENVAAIRLFSLDGRELRFYNADDSNVYSFHNEAPGNYILSLEDKDGRLFQAIELKKL